MKKYYAIIAFILALLAFVSCHKDKEFGSEKPEVGEVEVSSTLNQADFTWKVSYPGKFQTGVEISDNEALDDSRTVEGTKDGEVFKARVGQLEASTKYYYRIVVWNKVLRQEGEVKSFTTLTPDPDPDVYTVTVAAHPEEGGMVTGGGEYIADNTCTVKATANEGYTFVNWTENGGQISGEAEYTFVVTGNRNLVANFTSQAYLIHVDVDPEEGGTVTGAGGYNYNDECTLTATANEGYDFVNWTKEDGTQVSTNTDYRFTVTESDTYVAHFQKQSFTIEVSAEPSEGGVVTGGGTYFYGDFCTLTATALEGYDFVNWTRDGVETYDQSPFVFDVTEAASYVAHFQKKTFVVTVSADPAYAGSVTGGGIFEYGETCSLEAVAYDGYIFVNWTNNGVQASTVPSFSVVVRSDYDFVAHFREAPTSPIGAIDGEYSINEAGDQVYFSRGNLQYIGSATPSYWKFADYQWSYLGNNGQGSSLPEADRDLFGWGTSNYEHGAICYQPWSTTNDYLYYYAYGDKVYDLSDSTGMADWGYNRISNGGNEEHQWRTLSIAEWGYVLERRETPSGVRYAKAIVSDVCGVIILPDDWDGAYELENVNKPDAVFNGNVMESEEWYSSFEEKGAVFLPAAGSRNGESVSSFNYQGTYYTSSHGDREAVYAIRFFPNGFYNTAYTCLRYIGSSVRLVYDVERTK